jgi:NitT/TauT family transport system substrate-binding protein
MQALLLGKSEVTAHFASVPFQSEELKRPGIRTILNSYDVWGGPQTFILAWTTSRFREQSPKLYAAVLADPQVRFTLTPENVVKFVAFRVAIGTIRTMPGSWKDLFFPDIHHLIGS